MQRSRRVEPRSRVSGSARRLARVFAWLCVVVAARDPAVARAADEPSLEWRAPAGCPTQASVEAALAARLRETPAAARAELAMRAEARVSAQPGGRWGVALQMRTRDGLSERALVADDCDALADAVVLVVAMAVDPSAALADEPEPEPEPPPAPVEVPAPRPEAPAPAALDDDEDVAPEAAAPEAAPEPRAETRRPWGALALAAEVSVGTSGLPRAGAGFGGGLDFARRRWRVGVHGAYWLPRRHELASLGQPGASVLLSLGTIRARGCGVPGGARVEVPMCLALELGGMRGVGSGLPINGAFTGLWSAVVASPGLLVRLSTRVALSLRADAALAITRPTFTVAPLGAVYQAPRASLALALGLELRLGPSR